MNQEKKDQLIESIRRLTDPNVKSDQFVKKSLALQIPSMRRFLFLVVVSLAFFAVHYFLLVHSESYIENFTDLLGNINDIIVPTFAVIITGYAIFQALVNGSTLINLMAVNEAEKSKFEEYNLYFFGLSLLYLGIIILNLLLMLFFKNVPADWSLPFVSHQVNEIIASVLMTLYLGILMHSLIELKSFVYNLFQCFTINAVSSGIDFLKEHKEREQEEVDK
ncbi:hypothetical protein PDQ74_05845 [Bacillus cereus group sp. Bc005]|uniref:Uncharacterized protein n=1 Tax=Bacillus thuringiensis serovar iberica TaxID=180866 RepID=A0A9X6LAK2_BACTU|nr:MULTISPECIES: hypothetical protein [Bacillus cereus group]MEB9622861.1 hypothetical protein [Bacillus cereus]HDR5349732.1 hypothetical protein [Bacillus thuringiensis]MDA2756501.1 hypothetical protein [Bacillus cereus group sp. Bc007]MDA2762284.1 hypothetical protein [Bacillus cereus group sp. Bc008]MDA2773299.1 hypothetical protein [Bacillus cereus group sp. Bc005]